jgi:hypothetical protein
MISGKEMSELRTEVGCCKKLAKITTLLNNFVYATQKEWEREN